jgi:starch synthase (maltosyl-transferring)
MRIYNLFPLLAGSFHQWTPHLQRAADMGFDWIFVNPIQKLGRSGSLYSIKDYFAINPALCSGGIESPEDQVRSMVADAEGLGLKLMVDLVINHCAYDSDLLKEHPEWFVKEGNRIAHPYCTHEGEKVVWRDLAQFDHAKNRDPEGFYVYCRKIVEYLIGLGFKGFRCDAAYQLPAAFWRRLIADIKKAHPGIAFVAETLGCSADQTRQTAQAGFDAIFNSSKWWDFDGPWLMEQYHLTRETTPSISFPESHDTARLAEEAHGNVDLLKQRYAFAALFSAGVMIPMGFEFGFRKPLHVVNTKPSDWERTDIDISGFIRQVNAIKSAHRVFREDSITEIWPTPNPSVLLMWKAARDDSSEALLIFNKDPWNRQSIHIDDLYRYTQANGPLRDVSPQWPMDYLPSPFDYELTPGMARVLVVGE